MGDKTLLVLLIVFLVIGVFTYDQYITEKTGESPIAKLLDYGGLAEEGKKVDPTKTKVSKYATYQEGANHHLGRLSAKLKEIEDGRMKLIRDRNAIITQLIDLKDEAIKEAELYYEEIQQERDEFLAYKPDIEEIGRLLTETYGINNLKLRQKKLETIKAKISALNGNNTWGVSQQDIDELFEYINQSVVQKNLPYINNCQNTEQCLDANVKQATLFLNEVLIDFQQEVKPRFINAVKITQKTRKEYSDQIVYVDMNENTVIEQDEYFKGQYRELIQQLVKITVNDLNDLIQLHQELEMEQSNILETIKINSERLSQRFQNDREQMQRIVEKLEPQKLKKFDNFFKSLEKNKADEDAYLNKVMDIDSQLTQMLRHRTFENKLFLRNISALMEINVDRLVDDRTYASKLNAGYMNFRYRLEEKRRTVGIKDIYQGQKKPQMKKEKQKVAKPIKSSDPVKQPEMIKQPTKNVNNVKATIQKPDLNKQKIRQQNTLRDFDKARDKARDNGF